MRARRAPGNLFGRVELSRFSRHFGLFRGVGPGGGGGGGGGGERPRGRRE